MKQCQRYTLLASLCWHRQREITDNLVELLKHVTKVAGKTRLLYRIAKAATESAGVRGQNYRDCGLIVAEPTASTFSPISSRKRSRAG